MDEVLVRKAMQYAGTRTRREVVDIALREYLQSPERTKRNMAFFDSDVIDPSCDDKAARAGEAS